MTHVTHPIFVTHLTHDPWPMDPFPALVQWSLSLQSFVVAFVLSRLDYCNGVLALPERSTGSWTARRHANSPTAKSNPLIRYDELGPIRAPKSWRHATLTYLLTLYSIVCHTEPTNKKINEETKARYMLPVSTARKHGCPKWQQTISVCNQPGYPFVCNHNEYQLKVGRERAYMLVWLWKDFAFSYGRGRLGVPIQVKVGDVTLDQSRSLVRCCASNLTGAV